MILVEIFLALIVMMTFLLCWRLESGWRLVLSPFLLLMYFELVRVLPPFFLAENYANVFGVAPLLVAVAAFIGVSFGFLLAYYHKPLPRGHVLCLSVERVGPLARGRGERFGITVLVVVLVVVGFAFYGGLPPTVDAVVGLLRGGGRDFAAMVSQERFDLTKGAYFGSAYRGQGLFGALQRTGWSLMIVYSVLHWTSVPKGRPRRKASLYLLATIFATWLFVAGDGTRGAFLNVMLLGIAAFSLRYPLSLRTASTLFAAGVLAALVLGSYSNKGYGRLEEEGAFQVTVVRILERVFIGNGVNDVYVVDLVQRGDIELRWGANHVRDLRAALPGVEADTPLSHELYEIMNPFQKGTTFLSGTYLSSVYVDFGAVGVLPVFFLIGVTAGALQRRLLATPPTTWQVCFAASVGFLAVTMLRSGFIGFAVQLVILLILRGIYVVAVRIGAGASRRRLQAAGGDA